VGNTDRFVVTQGLARATTRTDIFWTAPTNAQGQVTRAYDLISTDHTSYGDHMQQQGRWNLVGSVSNNWAMDTDPITGNDMRFYRASPRARWSNAPPFIVSEEVYVAKPVPLRRGQNWVAFPGEPDTNTVLRVFGTNLPPGSTSADATKVTWYDRIGAESPTQQVWLAVGGDWQYSIGGSGDAHDVIVPLHQGVVIEIPVDAPEPDYCFLFVGRVPTNTLSQTVVGGAAYNLVSFRLPRRMHPSEMQLLSSGFTGGGFMFVSDMIWKYDRNAQSVPQVVWYNTSANQWRLANGSAVPAGYFGPDDALVIWTMGSPSNWTWTLDPAELYDPPARILQP
jgi:hypothetical protein